MKIAMQELIEYIESNEIVYNKDLILKLKELLEKEKEQMIDFYNWMRRNDSAEEYFHYSDEDMLTEYLNQNK
jgi:capsule polysaccharide export protein KpsE/RkpR